MTQAHAASLPLFSSIQALGPIQAWDASAELSKAVEALHLEEALEVVIVFDQEEVVVDLEPLSDYGSEVLEELRARSSFAPCPEDACEEGVDGACRWCGQVK